VIHTLLAGLEDDEVGLCAQDFFLDGLFKAAHHSQHDNQRQDSHRDPGDGDDRDDRDEGLFSFGF